MKKTYITGSSDFEFRADFFSLFNRVGMGDPDTDITDGPSSFGTIYGGLYGARIIWFSPRIDF